MNSHRCLHIVIAAAVWSFPAWTASANIGIASAISSYSVNGASVTGSSDIADGAALRTTTTPSNIRLAGGTDLMLATRSAGTVYGDHVALNEGALRVSNFAQYPVATRSLEISAETPQGEAIIRMKGDRVEVASLGGTVKVTDGGAMLTRVAAGTRMTFDDQAAAAPQDQTQGKTQTGASTPKKGGGMGDADRNALVWSIVAIAGTAAVLGIIAGVEGKSPF